VVANVLKIKKSRDVSALALLVKEKNNGCKNVKEQEEQEGKKGWITYDAKWQNDEGFGYEKNGQEEVIENSSLATQRRKEP
jgi:hypothetical protein